MLSAVQAGPAPSVDTAQGAQLQGCGGSPEAQLLALMVYSQVVQSESAQTSVELNQSQVDELRKQVREALEAAKENDDKSGFWGDIGDVLGGDIATLAGLVAMAAATAATGGAAAIALAAVAIGCSLASKYGEELGIPPKVALCIGLVAAGAAIAAGNVGSAAQVGNAASAGASAGAAGASAGASAGSAAANAGTSAARLAAVAKDVAYYAKIAQPIATGSGAVANVASGYYASEALDDQANAHAADKRSDVVSMDIDEAVKVLGQTIERQLSLCESGNQIFVANQNADQLIIQNFAGVA